MSSTSVSIESVVSEASRREQRAVWSRSIAYLIFFASGFAALVYEISWSRQIGLLFGHTVQAAGVVLAAYFSGLAAGYGLGSSRWASSRRPLVSYGVAELVAALWALAFPSLLLLAHWEPLAGWLSHPSASIQITTRALFSFGLLLPATTALGYTLPQMANWLAAESATKSPTESKTRLPTEPMIESTACPAMSQSASRVSFAYAMNTAGALAGVVTATFVLLVHVGVRHSSFLAAAISVACGIAAFALHLRSTSTGIKSAVEPALQPTVDSELEPARRGPTDRSFPIWTVMAALSGFGILALEVLYTRVFSLVFHNSTYTFGAVVTVFLGSLALGAALASKVQQRFNLRNAIGVCSALGSVAIIASLILFLAYTQLRYFTVGDTFLGYLAAALGLVTMVVGPPVMFLGMMLPMIWQAASVDSLNGKTVGRLTAVNSVAAAGGALIASFALPMMGLWQSFIFLAAIFFCITAVLLGKTTSKALLVIPFLLIVGGSFGMLRTADRYDRDTLRANEKLIRRWYSSYGWIDLILNEKSQAYKVRQNLHYRFGETGATAREFRQAHVPLLLHPNPVDVLFLGMGTGLTAGGAIPHASVRQIDVVELIPEVVDAASLLSEQNHGLVESPKVDVHVNDGRHFMLTTSRCFDVIVSDLFVPWESETGYLYTVEHYELARDRLQPGGLFCQCLPLYQVGTREFELIVDSLAEVFPNVSLWWLQLDSARPVIAMVGSDEVLNLKSNAIDRRLNALWNRTAVADPMIRNSDRLWNLYMGDWRRRPGATLNTDEHPRVEFLTPISNRDRKMIRGARLRDYFDDVLSRLPSQSVLYSDGDESSISSSDDEETRRAYQRFQLFLL